MSMPGRQAVLWSSVFNLPDLCPTARQRPAAILPLARFSHAAGLTPGTRLGLRFLIFQIYALLRRHRHYVRRVVRQIETAFGTAAGTWQGTEQRAATALLTPSVPISCARASAYPVYPG